jgi:hypothetical protein
MLGGHEQKWQGPLLVQPETVELAVRQTTVPDIDEQVVPPRRHMGSNPI